MLRAVSRSFYLSIRLLPARMRDPVAVTYLLARATDTIADTTEVAPSLREQMLSALAGTIQGRLSDDAVATLRQSFSPLQKNNEERALIEALPMCLHWLDSLENGDRNDARACLGKINRGQTLDVHRFGETTQVHALETARALDEYTYLVAGCVGEFWTQIGFRNLPEFAERPPQEMAALGVLYGKGLQLINILRDLGSDLRSGRCYLPADELRGAGLGPQEILQEPARALPIVERWREAAFDGIAAGMEYACAIRSRRVRFATALPALIGARTLAMLHEAGPAAFEREVKVPRTEVRKIMLRTIVSMACSRALHRTFHALSATKNSSAASR